MTIELGISRVNKKFFTNSTNGIKMSSCIEKLTPHQLIMDIQNNDKKHDNKQVFVTGDCSTKYLRRK